MLIKLNVDVKQSAVAQIEVLCELLTKRDLLDGPLVWY